MSRPPFPRPSTLSSWCSGLLVAAAALLATHAPAPADEQAPAAVTTAPDIVPVPAERMAWLPLSGVVRAELAAAHPRVAGRLAALAKRGAALRGQLAGRDLAPSARTRIQEQLDRADEEAGEALAQLLEVAPQEPITPALLRAIAAAPGGAHAELRHAMALGPVVADLTPAQHALLEYVRARIEGALAAIEAQRTVLPDALKEMPLDAGGDATRVEVRQRLERGLDRQVRAIERRWWSLLDYVLERHQRAAWFRSLPTAWLDKVNPAEQIYDLPGLTPSQAMRTVSLLTEYEAESSPDEAAVRRLRAERDAPGVDDETKKTLQRDLGDAQKRVAARGLALARALKAVLTDEQYEAFQAIPPRLSSADRRERGEKVLEGVAPTPAQLTRLEALREELLGTVKALQQRAAELNREKAEYGPDSPQQMMMMAQLAGVRGEGARLGRQALGTVFLDVLTPDQVAAWVLDPRAR